MSTPNLHPFLTLPAHILRAQQRAPQKPQYNQRNTHAQNAKLIAQIEKPIVQTEVIRPKRRYKPGQMYTPRELKEDYLNFEWRRKQQITPKDPFVKTCIDMNAQYMVQFASPPEIVLRGGS